jgi:hypothetical protein
MKWATTGTTWNYKTKLANNIFQVAYNGTNLYVAVGAGGVLYTSPDATTWTSRTSGFSSSGIFSVAYGNNIWVAVGNSGIITTSTDGITWTARTSNLSTNAIYTVRYVNTLFIACANGGAGGSGGIATSTDGITWTKRTTPANGPTNYADVAYGGGYYVAGGQGGSSTNIVYSTDGITWTASTANTTPVYWIGYVNSIWATLKLDGNGGPNYISGAPTGTWNASATELVVTANPNTGASAPGTTGIFGNNIYSLQFGIPTGITNVNLPAVIYGSYNLYSGGYSLTPISTPGTSSNVYINVFYINPSNGQIIIVDNTGRVYTSF